MKKRFRKAGSEAFESERYSVVVFSRELKKDTPFFSYILLLL